MLLSTLDHAVTDGYLFGMTYVKLHGTILDSSVWMESASTRIVWITMLAMADQHGVVQASVGGLAHRARVTRAECEEAVRCFTSPDPDSRDGTTGERIEAVPGGWMILNHANYRDIRTKEQIQIAARVAKHRARIRAVTGNEVTQSNALTAYASVHASVPLVQGRERERGGEGPVTPVTRPAKDPDPPEGFSEFWEAYGYKKKQPEAIKAWRRIDPDEGLRATIVRQAAATRAANPSREFYAYPATWLNNRCWEDEIVPKSSGGRKTTGQDWRERSGAMDWPQHEKDIFWTKADNQ